MMTTTTKARATHAADGAEAIAADAIAALKDMEAVVRRSFSSENATARHALHLIAEARHYVESAQYAITEAAR